MLTGEYKHALDTKYRLFIPAKHREELGSAFMIVRDIRGPRLKVYSKEKWEAYIAPLRLKDPDVQDEAMRWFNQASVEGMPDAQGRVTITSNDLLEYAGFVELDEDGEIQTVLSRDAVIVGCGDYAEIWEAQEYKRAKRAVRAADIRAALKSCGL